MRTTAETISGIRSAIRPDFSARRRRAPTARPQELRRKDPSRPTDNMRKEASDDGRSSVPRHTSMTSLGRTLSAKTAYWAAWSACTVLTLGVIFVPEYLPMVDLPQHAGQIAIWLDWNDPASTLPGRVPSGAATAGFRIDRPRVRACAFRIRGISAENGHRHGHPWPSIRGASPR